MIAPVKLDLRTGLPKARRAMPRLLKLLPKMKCEYRAPCVVGSMIAPPHRKKLDEGCPIGARNYLSNSIGDLVECGVVEPAKGQRRDITRLQESYDSGDEKKFLRTFERLEKKYAPASGIEAGTDETAKTGSAEGESPVAKPDAQTDTAKGDA